MSQKELADKYCSTKYIYLIEKGERTPSSNLLRKFSNKLGIDFFELYEYLECKDPMAVFSHIKSFDKYKRRYDYKNLEDLTNQLRTEPDFLVYPWKCELEINDLTRLIVGQRKAEQGIERILVLLKECDLDVCCDKHIAELYCLLGGCYLLIGKTEECFRVLDAAGVLIHNKTNMSQFHQVYILMKLELIYYYLLTKEYHDAVQEGLVLLGFQRDNNLFERIHCTLFMVMAGYARLGQDVKAVDFCKQALWTVLAHHKEFEARRFMCYEVFLKILHHSLMDEGLVREFADRFQFDISELP